MLNFFCSFFSPFQYFAANSHIAALRHDLEQCKIELQEVRVLHEAHEHDREAASSRTKCDCEQGSASHVCVGNDAHIWGGFPEILSHLSFVNVRFECGLIVLSKIYNLFVCFFLTYIFAC